MAIRPTAACIPASWTLEEYYNVKNNEVNVKELLGDVFMVIVPEQNIEGYEHMDPYHQSAMTPPRDEGQPDPCLRIPTLWPW